MGVKIKDDNKIPELIKSLTGMSGKNIEAGVLEDGKQAMIAHVHEYGVNIQVTPRMRAYLHYIGIHLRKDTTHIRIPERSYLRSGWDQSKGDIYKKIESMLSEVMENKMDANKFLDMIGLEVEGKLKKKLVEVSAPSLSDVTIERKGSSNPLVDTGSLLSSISNRVK